MTDISIEQRIVFGVTPEPNDEGNIALLLGVPHAAWEFMQDGKTHTVDLSKFGLPIHILLFGTATHAEAVAVITEHNKRLGLPTEDQGHVDFSAPAANDT